MLDCTIYCVGLSAISLGALAVDGWQLCERAQMENN